MVKCDLTETSCNKANLVFYNLSYSFIIRNIKELSRDFQTHLEASLTLVYSEIWHFHNLCISRTFIYSEAWYIEKYKIIRTLVYSKPWHIQNPNIFKSLLYSEPSGWEYSWKLISIVCEKKKLTKVHFIYA